MLDTYQYNKLSRLDHLHVCPGDGSGFCIEPNEVAHASCSALAGCSAFAGCSALAGCSAVAGCSALAGCSSVALLTNVPITSFFLPRLDGCSY